MTEDEILICPRCNKRTYRDDAHTCAPPALLAEYERQIEALREATRGCGASFPPDASAPGRYMKSSPCGQGQFWCMDCFNARDIAIRNLIGVNNG